MSLANRVEFSQGGSAGGSENMATAENGCTCGWDGREITNFKAMAEQPGVKGGLSEQERRNTSLG